MKVNEIINNLSVSSVLLFLVVYCMINPIYIFNDMTALQTALYKIVYYSAFGILATVNLSISIKNGLILIQDICIKIIDNSDFFNSYKENK